MFKIVKYWEKSKCQINGEIFKMIQMVRPHSGENLQVLKNIKQNIIENLLTVLGELYFFQASL